MYIKHKQTYRGYGALSCGNKAELRWGGADNICIYVLLSVHFMQINTKRMQIAFILQRGWLIIILSLGIADIVGLPGANGLWRL
jgi:hypothetical protein